MEIPKFDAVEKTRFHDVTWVAEIPSTNTALLERARQGALEGEVIIADLQTAGRGRRGRTWTAPAGRPADPTGKGGMPVCWRSEQVAANQVTLPGVREVKGLHRTRSVVEFSSRR